MIILISLIALITGFIISKLRYNRELSKLLTKIKILEQDIQYQQKKIKKFRQLFVISKNKIYQLNKSINIKNKYLQYWQTKNNKLILTNKIEKNREIIKYVSNIINPLQEQVNKCLNQLHDSIRMEVNERHILNNEIKEMQKLNSNITQSTINLANALKGNSKFRGNCGEIILSRILESAGLREGYEYETQISIKSDQNSKIRPDIIIRLPKGKDIIVDSKMILLAYEKYFNSKDDIESEKAIKEHINAIKTHIRLLSKKNYQDLPNLRSLDYILMFIPIEQAFLLAIDREPSLLFEALKQNIMLVSPTTLLVVLRTIHNLWNNEHQNQNVHHIVDSASKLYDKIRLFVDEMNNIGYNLDKTYNSYKEAMKKLAEGRGNIIKQTEKFRQLGVDIKCAIDIDLVNKSSLTENVKK
ncbi:DNA recombination protein RmuC [Candidatus Pantoea edessiphila]|uniref:DNA recombination protein RmuC n=1 Tax=Candidatus Pantoea edessiphila TaxID=2044610 RepID=A0A2P5SZE3_9GAMM|nr:DNA recombination protein RmuC [Candidatus Pantoea edessiphila]PPI87672.1 DNA recombination protein RmuC [Candidatus Pantoea edessiphila]